MSMLFYNLTVHFARPDALSGSLIDTLKEVRPTIFMGVPRIYEKMEEKMKAIGASVGPLAKKISTWAKGKGLENSMSI
jgi:long-chain-fatty-acid--CoA ligase ACSBG